MCLLHTKSVNCKYDQHSGDRPWHLGANFPSNGYVPPPPLASPPSPSLEAAGHDMATARERLVHSSEKLRLAFSSLQAINQEVVARTTGVGDLPLSQATARRVSQAANMGKTVALSILKAAEAAEVAAATAAEAVWAVEAAKSAAAAKSEAEKTAVKAAEPIKAAAEPLKSEIDPSVASDRYVIDRHFCNAERFVCIRAVLLSCPPNPHLARLVRTSSEYTWWLRARWLIACIGLPDEFEKMDRL